MSEAASDPTPSKYTAPTHPRNVRVSANSRVTPPNRLATRFFFAIIAFAPLPFGSDSSTAVAFWCVCLAAAAALCRTSDLNWPQEKILFGIALLLCIYGVVVFLQISSVPWIVAADPIWAKAAKLLGGQFTPTAAIARYVPIYSLGRILANFLALSLGLILGADRQRAREILVVFAWSGAAYAIFGIVSAVVEPGMILWRERPGYYGNVLGTFINRNTAATYFGSCAAVWLLILCEIIKSRLTSSPLTWKNFSRKILSDPRPDMIICFLGLFICVMALFMTNSRAGVLISLSGLIGTGAIYFRHDLPRASTKFWVVAGAMCVALLLLQFLGGSVNQRFDTSGLSDEGRLDTYRSTLRIIADHPWLGTGLGTFVWAFPEYRSPTSSMYGVWDMAHSTPLQLVAEMGIPIALFVGAAWIGTLSILVRGILVRRRDTIIPLAALTVALIGLIHSCVDFSLQIPGYAIVAMSIIGVGLAQSFRTATSD